MFKPIKATTVFKKDTAYRLSVTVHTIFTNIFGANFHHSAVVGSVSGVGRASAAKGGKFFTGLFVELEYGFALGIVKRALAYEIAIELFTTTFSHCHPHNSGSERLPTTFDKWPKLLAV